MAAAENPAERKGPSQELPADVDFLDTELGRFAYDEPLDLGEHGSFDPQAETRVSFTD